VTGPQRSRTRVAPHPRTTRTLSNHPVADAAEVWYIYSMTVKDIETALTKLPPRELKEFRSWFERFDAEEWDEQFEADAKSGKLDRLADQALTDFENGRCTDL